MYTFFNIERGQSNRFRSTDQAKNITVIILVINMSSPGDTDIEADDIRIGARAIQ